MLYSLLNRFQGTFMGTLIGANIGHTSRLHPWWFFLSQAITKRLTQKGRLSSEDWSVITGEQTFFGDNSKLPNTGELILGTLPLMVFFHDAPSLLWEQLHNLVVKWQLSLETLQEMMVWGELLALILTENLEIKGIVSQQLTYYHNQSNSSLRDSLKQVESFLQLRTSLRQVIDYFNQQMLLERSALPLAIYCFTVTPEDFSVAVLRAAQTQSQVITALVGALAGAYNSCFGIPPHWQSAFKKKGNSQLMNHIIPELWAMWTGSNYRSEVGLSFNISMINSPWVMQKRSSVKLVSQKEYWLF